MTLEDVCEGIFDCPHSTPKLCENGPFLVRTQDIREGYFKTDEAAHVSLETYKLRIKRAAPRYGDLLFSREGTYFGDAAEVPPDTLVCLGQRMVLLRPNNAIVSSSFLRIWINSISFQRYLTGFRDGTVAERLNLTTIRKLPAIVPPIFYQNCIVEKILPIEQKIAVNRSINKKLEEIAQAIFKSWFVNFEPVKAKIEAKVNGQDPERAAMCAISGKTDAELDQIPADQLAQLRATAALFPDELTESELGSIPKGWKIKEIKDWGAVICGKTPPKKDASNYGGNVPFIKIPDMHGNVFATRTSDTLSQKGALTQPKKQVPAGSICVSCIATVGQVVLTSEDSHTNQQINTIVPAKITHNYYLFFSMRERKNLLHELASGGSATLNLNTGNFSKIPILYPNDSLVDNFYQKVSSCFEAILLNDKQSQTIEGMRNTLLPKLLSGEIDLSQVD